MKIKAFILCLMLLPTLSFAGGGEHMRLDSANVDLGDRDSLQRGARLFVNYCLNCHAAAYMRYSRMGDDLGLSKEQVEDNLMYASDKVGSLMKVATPADDAAGWFGAPPPDLSVVSRSRGPDWLYTYLRSFYVDNSPSRPFGVNNRLFKDVAMPHVLWELQGWQAPVYKTVTDEHTGKEHEVLEDLELVEPGAMTEKEYDRAVRDLVNFMTYMGEPAKLKRYSVGAKVLLFLLFFFAFAYMLKKEYWKDVH